MLEPGTRDVEPVEARRLAQPPPDRDRRVVIPAPALLSPKGGEPIDILVGLAEEVQETGEQTRPPLLLGDSLVAAAPGTALHLGVQPKAVAAAPLKNPEHSDLK